MVYAKRPFGGPEQVLNYLGRYTHRVAISNNRLLDIDHGQVSFHWKDYPAGDQQKTMTLEADEFIRRFLLHVLPDGFQRIRHYGFLGHRYREAKLALCRRLLGMPVADSGGSPLSKDYLDHYEDLTGESLRECPQCQQGTMVVVQILRGQVPNLRRSLTPHDPSNRLRIRDEKACPIRHHRRSAHVSHAYPSSYHDHRPLILRCTRAVTSETVPLHSQSRHACTISPPTRDKLDHSKPIGRTEWSGLVQPFLAHRRGVQHLLLPRTPSPRRWAKNALHYDEHTPQRRCHNWRQAARGHGIITGA